MRLRNAIIGAVFFLGVGLPQSAYATQPQDWYLGAADEGTFWNVGFFFPGVITSVDHRLDLYGSANQLTLSSGGMVTYPFGNGYVETKVRFLIMTLGAAVGFQDTWRNLSFGPDERFDRQARRRRDGAGEFDNSIWPYVEGKGQLAFPFNDYLLFVTDGIIQHVGSPERSYDWRQGIVHDGGLLYHWNSMLFVKHKKFGGIGPTVQFLDFSLDDDRHTQVNAGFTLLSRAGLTRWNDYFAVQMMFYVGMLDDYDNRDVWAGVWRGPWNLLIAYFSSIPLLPGPED